MLERLKGGLISIDGCHGAGFHVVRSRLLWSRLPCCMKLVAMEQASMLHDAGCHGAGFHVARS